MLAEVDGTSSCRCRSTGTTINRPLRARPRRARRWRAFFADAPSGAPASSNSETRSSRGSAATSSRDSSAATRASSGASTPRELDAAVCGRIPVRTNPTTATSPTDFQRCPRTGTRAMFERMLDQPGIDVATSTTFREAADRARFAHVVYTGPIDEYFGSCSGLYRIAGCASSSSTLRRRGTSRSACVNYPGPEPFTRVTEFQHLTGQHHAGTTIAHEYATAAGRSVLPGAAPGEPCPVRKIRGQSRAPAARHLRGPARRVSLLQHGSGRGVGPDRLRANRRRSRRFEPRASCSAQSTEEEAKERCPSRRWRRRCC